MKFDRKARRKKWAKALSAESAYNRKLVEVAKIIGTIVDGMAPDGVVTDMDKLIKVLTDYAELLTPWAESVAGFMLADVARRDKAMWWQNSKEMAQGLTHEIETAPTGGILRALQAEQVTLIKSLPLEAATRVHELSVGALTDSSRASTLAKEILATSSVTESRARLIARTEVSRASSNLLQARAQWKQRRQES